VCRGARWTLIDFASACIDGGATCLQVRAKLLSGGSFLEAAEAIVQRARAAGAQVIVNDRADVARGAGAHGVHVGQEDLAPADVRILVGPEAVIGLSTHTMEQFERALREPVSYLAVGPMFASDTKATGYEEVGLAHLQRTAKRAADAISALPIVAIGGINLDRAPKVIAAGASSVAVISDLLATGDPAARVRQFLAALR
jgi:thiamine-phosphate pyrophosphorylase